MKVGSDSNTTRHCYNTMFRAENEFYFCCKLVCPNTCIGIGLSEVGTKPIYLAVCSKISLTHNELLLYSSRPEKPDPQSQIQGEHSSWFMPIVLTVLTNTDC